MQHILRMCVNLGIVLCFVGASAMHQTHATRTFVIESKSIMPHLFQSDFLIFLQLLCVGGGRDGLRARIHRRSAAPVHR